MATSYLNVILFFIYSVNVTYMCIDVITIYSSSSNSNWTFIALNLPKQEDSKVQQNKKQSIKFLYPGTSEGSSTMENARNFSL